MTLDEIKSAIGVKPYYEEPAGVIYCADCLDILPKIPEKAVDLVLTDPPYSSGGFQEAGKSGGSIGTRSSETIQYDNLSTRGYERLMRKVLRFTNQTDEIYIFTDWRMWINTFDAIESGGWRIRNMLVWDKMVMGMGMPWRNQHELIAFGKRSPGRIIDGKLGNVLQYKRSGNKNHPTEKPIDLIKTLIGNSDSQIGNSDSQTILDPFLGSGTTAVAAKQLGRQYIGIEISEKYCEIAVQRLAQEILL